MDRPVYQLFMIALSVLALATIAVQNAFRLDPQVELLLEYFDNALCVAFLADFVLTMWRTPNRGRYFMTWGWLDLLSSIPTLDLARWGRLARIARLARLRSEEHTSELQSQSNLVCRLLLEKKKKKK